MTEEELKLLDEIAISAMNYLLKKHKVTDSCDFDESEIATISYNIACDMIQSRQDLLKDIW